MPEFREGDQARSNFEAGLSLSREYFSAGQAVGTTLIAIMVAIFGASITVLDQVVPLEDAASKEALIAAWFFLFVGIISGLVTLLLEHIPPEITLTTWSSVASRT